MAAGYNWPQFSIHRGDLLGVLHAAVAARLGADRVHLSMKLSSVSEDAKGIVSATFRSASGDKIIRCDALVGCDGVHSVVRRILNPSEGAPLWNGILLR
jgi:2-polyprenyl-6-methoxyphenol hydroxylase-like FAD-dependent oxidoreductase